MNAPRTGRTVAILIGLALGTTVACDVAVWVAAVMTDTGTVPEYHDPLPGPPR